MRLPAEQFGGEEAHEGGDPEPLRSEPASTAEAAANAARAAAAARLKEEELKRRSLEEDAVGEQRVQTAVCVPAPHGLYRIFTRIPLLCRARGPYTHPCPW